MLKCKHLVLGAVMLVTAACAQESHRSDFAPVESVGWITASPAEPTTSFKRCHLFTRVISVSGRTYVLHGLQCQDDRGNWVVVN